MPEKYELIWSSYHWDSPKGDLQQLHKSDWQFYKSIHEQSKSARHNIYRNIRMVRNPRISKPDEER